LVNRYRSDTGGHDVVACWSLCGVCLVLRHTGGRGGRRECSRSFRALSGSVRVRARAHARVRVRDMYIY